MPSLFYFGVVGFLAGVAGESISRFPLIVPAGVGIFSALCLVRKKRFVAIFLIALTLGAARASIAERTLPPDLELYLEKAVRLQGVIAVPPDVRESSTRITVDVGSTRILAVVPARPSLQVGDVVRAEGLFVRPEPFDADGGRTFRYDEFLAKDGIFAMIDPARIEFVRTDTDPLFAAWRVLASGRDALIAALNRALPQPESALAAGIIAGGKQGLGKELLEAFTIAGLLQIVVLSGFNVMIIANGILRALSFLPVRLSWALSVAGLSAFVIGAGAGSAALRAGLMAIFAISARGLDREYLVLPALCASLVLLVLWNPLLLVYDPGLQLSFIATLGLVVGMPLLERPLRWIRSTTIRELVGTTFAAQIAVLPLLLYQSGNLSLVAFLANVLASPVIPFAMAFSAGAAGLAFLPSIPLAAVQVFALPAYVLLAYVLKVATVSASLPFAQLIVPAFPWWLMCAAYAVMGWFVYAKTPADAGVSRA